MTFGKTTFTLLVLLLLAAGNVLAAPQGLFYLGGLQQSVGLEYNYSLMESRAGERSTSNSSHLFGEVYRAGGHYAILSPQFLTGRFMVRFNLNQGYSYASGASDSARSSKIGLLYNLDGTFYEREASPVTFFSRAENKRISRSFSPDYEIDSQSHGVGISIHNVLLPAHLSYQQTTSETSGLGNDQRYESMSVSVGVSHSTQNSASDVQFAYSENDSKDLATGQQFSAASSLISGRNRMTSTDRKKSLNSSFRYNKSISDDTEYRASFSLSEGFAWQLGKALALGLHYGWDTSRGESEGAPDSKSTAHSAGMSLTHKLFQSLESRFDLNGRKFNRDNGEQTTLSGSVAFDYRKTVAPGSILDLHYNESLAVTNQNLGSQILTVADEEFRVATSGDNLLINPDVVITSIVVRDAANPAIRYLSEAESLTPDYRTIQVGSFTGLDINLPGSRLLDGAGVVVSYSYLVDPQASYTTSQRTVSGGLGFADIYRVFASISQSEQHYSEGEETVGSGQSLSYSIGGSRTVDGVFASIVYASIDSPRYSRQYVEGVFRSQYYYQGATIQFQGSDRYSVYDQSAGSGEGWDNRFSLSASGSRSLFRNGTVRLSTQYLNVTSETTTLDGVSAEGNYRWNLGKLSLDTSVRSGYRNINGDNTVWESKFSLRVMREF